VSNNKHHTFFHGHSFTANPIACSAANASLDLMADSDFENRVLMIIQRFEKEKLKFAQHEALIETRVLGCILALEIKTTGVTGYLNGLSEKATDFFLKKGIYLRPLGNVLYVTPPYIISENELDTIFNAIDEFLIQHLEFLKTGL
jgi:adenosylmethionine-8-amino-7-oxononanoate aminotransferase